MKIVGVALVILGALALAYGGFTYTRTRDRELGPIHFQVKEKERVSVPVWAGLSAVGVGAGLMFFAKKK